MLITSFLSIDSKFERESRRTNVKNTFISHQNSMITSNKNTKASSNGSPQSTTPKQNNRVSNQVMMDFVMKIMDVNDRKVRLQLWEIAGSSNAQHAFAPLFIRNAVGCVIMANANNSKSIKEVKKWKQKFDESTSLPSEKQLPSAIFINHISQDDSSDDVSKSIEIKPKLKALCSELQEELKIPIFHINALTSQNLLEAFQGFMSTVIKHQEDSRMRSDILDDLISQDDESLMRFDTTSVQLSIQQQTNLHKTGTAISNSNLFNKPKSPLSQNRYPAGRGGHISGYDRQSVQLNAKYEKQSNQNKQSNCAC
eukprot:403353452